jgi:quercetin dioxygenase-like cupin family protein
MQSVLRSALRVFSSEEHIRNLLTGAWVDLVDDSGNRLVGIRGRIGAVGLTLENIELGADLIEMDAGSAFPLHTHPGDHMLYVIRGRGLVHVDGRDYPVVSGDSIFVPADYPHGVKTYADSVESFCFLAVGHPHKHLSSPERMIVVKPVSEESGT